VEADSLAGRLTTMTKTGRIASGYRGGPMGRTGGHSRNGTRASRLERIEAGLIHSADTVAVGMTELEMLLVLVPEERLHAKR
jgi:hypothetical protein